MERDSTIAELLRPWAKPGEYRIERKAVYRFHARACARFSKGRVFLVGDAAHITPPFIGQGLVSGLRDAANLAWKLAWVIQGRASASILDSYDQERRPHASKMIALARFTGLLVMPRSHLRAWLSHGVLKLLRQIPLLRAHFDEFRIKPANAYGKGLFVRGRGRRIAHGAWFPQGLVRDGDGSCKLSDELLGLGFSLVCTGAVSPALDAATARAWEAVGGTTTRIARKGSGDAVGLPEDTDDTFTKLTAAPWCVVVRPDRTVLHQGPLADVNRIVTESIALVRGDRLRQRVARSRRPFWV
jgi:3-(3-hydroxy-phenyl)propionate hydroxylase